MKKQSQELTRVNPDQNIFSINVELTSAFLLYRGLVHHHHRILNHKSIDYGLNTLTSAPSNPDELRNAIGTRELNQLIIN